MTPLALVRLDGLMARTAGASRIMVGLIDGPVNITHPDLAGATIRGNTAGCAVHAAGACRHATFVAGILCGRRDSAAPGLCPNCAVFIRPIFSDLSATASASSVELARAVRECVAAGARVVNISAGPPAPAVTESRPLIEALDAAARHGVLVVAAAGNSTALGTSTLTRHPWVMPVIAVDSRGHPVRQSTMGRSIGRNGLAAPGTITSSIAGGGAGTLTGTSFAAPIVTGTVALLWSLFPAASASEIRAALLGRRHTTLIPPLLNAEAAYHQMKELVHAR